MNREEIEAQFKAIRKVTDLRVSIDDPAGMEQNLLDLKSISGNSSEMVRVCEEILLNRHAQIIESLVDRKMSPNVLAMYLDAKNPYETSCLTYAKNLNEKVGNCISAIQSLMKSRTEEMRNSH